MDVRDIFIGCGEGVGAFFALLGFVSLFARLGDSLLGAIISWGVSTVVVSGGSVLIWRGIVAQGDLKILVCIGPFVILAGIILMFVTVLIHTKKIGPLQWRSK